MSLVSIMCFGICSGIVLSMFMRGADPLSPARLFGFIWSLAIALAELKLSGLQHEWNATSWLLLLTGIGFLLAGISVAYVLNLRTAVLPITAMRQLLRQEEVRENRLFWLICLGAGIYLLAYLANYLIRGWLPIAVVGTKTSRVEFNVSGLTLFLFSAAFIIFFTVLYHVQVRGKKGRKIILTTVSLIVLGSYLLLLQRYQIIMAVMISFTLLYYATHFIRLRTALPLVILVVAFFYWIASLRLGQLLVTYIYWVSKMRFSVDYAFLTEPYMYVVMNLENFARAVNLLDRHTYGYFTFDFVTAISGLKYWAVDYFGLNRSPFLTSSYNTYTAFWWFYSDFGVIGLAAIPLLLGFGVGMLYYRMRSNPTIKSVTAYGVMVFVLFISYFNFPFAFLWFEYNILALFLLLRWTVVPRRGVA